LGIILQGGLIGRLVRRFGERRLITSGFLSSMAAYLLLALIGQAKVAGLLIPAIAVLVLSATTQAYGSGILRPNITSLVTQHVDRNQQGTILGLNQSLLSMGQIIGPVVGGFLITRGQLAAWGLWAAALALCGFLLSRLSPEPHVQPEPELVT